MLTILTQTFKGPPLWVWPLFVYLIARGIIAFKPRIMPLKKIFILPSVFFFLSIQRLVSNINFLTCLVWLLSIIIGAFLSFVIFKNIQVGADKKNNLLKLPGSYSTLVLILISFSIKFYFWFIIAKDPILLKDSMFFYRYILATSLSFGMFLGRTLLYFYKFKKTDSTSLLDTKAGLQKEKAF